MLKNQTEARFTRQRLAIQAVLGDAVGPLSAQEILRAAARVCDDLGIATVYRNLKKMQDQAYIKAVVMPDGGARFERADLEHHHHFLCTQCNRVYDIAADCALASSSLPPGFSAEHHDVVLSGLCSVCGQNAKKSLKRRA